jgi:hypothetical protein
MNIVVNVHYEKSKLVHQAPSYTYKIQATAKADKSLQPLAPQPMQVYIRKRDRLILWTEKKIYMVMEALEKPPHVSIGVRIQTVNSRHHPYGHCLTLNERSATDHAPILKVLHNPAPSTETKDTSQHI